jgi:hypothetical protein
LGGKYPVKASFFSANKKEVKGRYAINVMSKKNPMTLMWEDKIL